MNLIQKGLRIAGFIVIGIGGLFVVRGVYIAGLFLYIALATISVSDQREELEDFQLYAAETLGTVLEAGNGHTIVEYYDEDGIRYETEVNIYHVRFNEGSEIIVWYDEEKPEVSMVPILIMDGPSSIAPSLGDYGGIVMVASLCCGIFLIIIGINLIKLKKKTEKTD